MINLPNLTNIADIERIREQTTYGNHSFGLLLYSLTHAKCVVPTLREHASGNAEERRVVEIGFFIGYSALMFAAAIADSGKPGKVISVDREAHELGTYNVGLSSHLKERHELVVGDSVEVADTVRGKLGGPADILLIDGDHTYEGCRRDFDAYEGMLAEDGLLLLHDGYDPGVQKVIHEVEGWNLVNLGGWAALTMGSRLKHARW